MSASNEVQPMSESGQAIDLSEWARRQDRMIADAMSPPSLDQLHRRAVANRKILSRLLDAPEEMLSPIPPYESHVAMSRLVWAQERAITALKRSLGSLHLASVPPAIEDALRG